MSLDLRIIIAGFGGQGILFAGKFLTYAGMLEGHEVSWLPSYGPEMRGGTASVAVSISDRPIGSPVITKPNVIAVMNLPSLDKYEPMLVAGGKAFIDSSMIAREAARTDITSYYVPATQIGRDHEIVKLANIVLMGKLLKELDFVSKETIEKTMQKIVPAKKPELYDFNMKAVNLGMQL